MTRHRTAACFSSALILLSLCACVVEESSSSRSMVRTRPEASGNGEPGLLDQPIATRVQGRTSAVVAAVQPRGAIPYDNMTLPIVSPDGRFIATQVGLAPSWATIVAQPDATVPDTVGIEIYEIPQGSTEALISAGQQEAEHKA